MKYFKDRKNTVHAIEDGFESWLPTGCIEITPEQVEALTQTAPTQEQIIAAFTEAIQLRLDGFARSRNYDGILSACSYVASGVPAFAAEAACCIAARDATWATGYQILADVQAGTRPMPTLAEVEAELPTLEWPT